MSHTVITFTDEQKAEISELAEQYRQRVEGQPMSATPTFLSYVKGPSRAQPEYLYDLHEEDSHIILVRRNEMRFGWKVYGIFHSVQSAALALESLRMAAERECAARGRERRV